MQLEAVSTVESEIGKKSAESESEWHGRKFGSGGYFWFWCKSRHYFPSCNLEWVGCLDYRGFCSEHPGIPDQAAHEISQDWEGPPDQHEQGCVLCGDELCS